jgi:two-component system cell cycle sensor histidine kinase/response regulator CckA
VRPKITAEPVKGSGTILVIDDDEDVLSVSLTILERLGYHVLLAKSGEETVEIANGFDEKIDLAILDIGLPDIPGDRLYQMLKKIRPDIRVLVSTGYAVEDIGENLKRAVQGFIQKPISFSKLSIKLKEVLGELK